MDIVIDAQVSEDRRLIYELPPEVPVGRVKLTIQPVAEEVPAPSTPSQPLTREEARRRLAAAGMLVTTRMTPEDAVPLTDEELQRLANLFGGGPMTTLDIINEDRGPR
jgi:hypothetical protein